MRTACETLVAKLEHTAKVSYVPGYHLALAHTGLGNRDAAFAYLARASTDRDPVLVNLAVEPRFEPLHRDARYAALVGELRLGR